MITMPYGMSLNSTPDWDKIRQYLAQVQQSQPPANFQPPAPQGYAGPMPYVSPTENNGIAGGVNIGQMGVSGAISPHEWAAMLRYNRGF